MSGTGRNPARDRILVALAVLALAVAGGLVYRQISSTMPHEVGRINLPPGSSPKVQYMKEHGGGAPGADPFATPPQAK